jgi:hypothetical protein
MLVPVPSFDDVPDAAASDTAASDTAASDAAATDAAPSPETRALAQRHDGITPERQRIFVEVLAATGSVSQAARQAGASRQAFYAHRNRDAGRDFLEAWDHAQARSTQLLCDAAYERAIYGVEEPVFYHGEQIGTRRRYNDKLLATLLRVRAPDDYAPPGDRRGLFRVSLTPPASFDDMIAELGLPEPEPEPEPEPPRRRRRLRGPA